VIEHFRWRGHLSANLDPLGLAPSAMDPEIALDCAALSIVQTGNSLDEEGSPLGGANIAAMLRRLKSIYCDTVGYEYMHLTDAEAREWLRQRIECGEGRLDDVTRIAAARRLIEADEFEQFLAKRFVGKKVFGAEGAESLLSLLWAILEKGVSLGLRSVVMGGTSRGRLNQLVNFLGKPAMAVFAELADKSEVTADPDSSGDVPYHLGYSGQHRLGDATVTLTYCANPSHLEAVNTVAIGRVCALQHRSGGNAKNAIMPLLVHTDASFAGQGVVGEAFQLSGLEPYAVGGAIHVIINNQIGFTTEPSQGRSSRYCTDAAKGIGVPVFHVNADDADAVVKVGQLAMEYRQRFHGDVVVDLVCYRRKGHNELDEPAFTQPLMYERIARHPGARRIYLDLLASQGVFNREDETAHASRYRDQLADAYQASPSYKPNSFVANAGVTLGAARNGSQPNTGVPQAALGAIGIALSQVPAGIRAHPKITQIFEQRAAAIEADTGINWGFAEALALGSLVSEGISIRLSGQDTPRGAFSHRHYYVHDQETGRRASILENLPQPHAPAQVFETPLAEYATLGFEYGYSLEAENALVIWEAQFGDFANVAQPIFDQFISAGYDKWREISRLAVLLPHGLEGQGSEHSSGRIERFLQLCAKDNMTVANCTTPANYFHLLRRQALFANTPLLVFTPKSLLRHRLAVSSLLDMSEGTAFRPLIGPEPTYNANRI
ncbi:MAG TPA: 2-oxoglutarate dehydrogenase E1 component, partial [Hyphomicrobiales bacterium]|nr:2-oxoglutarate dehydrogenase E1 component [Hyphomicrobiales bacterium]